MAAVELICHFYLPPYQMSCQDNQRTDVKVSVDESLRMRHVELLFILHLCNIQSVLKTKKKQNKNAPTLTSTVMEVVLTCNLAISKSKKKTGTPTEKSNSKALQDASPLPKEEITPGVCQETYQSTGEGDKKVSDGQIHYNVVQGLSELFVLESDKHDEEIFAQRQRGDHKHQHGQDSEVPRRDVLDGCIERIISSGEFRCHGVGHSVHRQT